MQLGTRPRAALKMCPDKLTQFNPDGDRQETMGLPILAQPRMLQAFPHTLHFP